MEMCTLSGKMPGSASERRSARWETARALLVAGAAMAMGLAGPEPATAQGDPALEKLRAQEQGGREVRETPVQKADRWVRGKEYDRAIALCHSRLRPDSSDARLRAMLAWAYAGRDRVCLPLALTSEAFATGDGQEVPCDLGIVAPATRDSILAVYDLEEALAPEALASHLPRIEYEFRFGTPAAVSARLERLRRFNEAEVQRHLIEQLAAIHRPPMMAAAARYLLGTDLGVLDCPSLQRVITSLVTAADFDGALEVIGHVPADGVCDRQLLPATTMALAVGGRYPELWDRAKVVPADLDPRDYYRYALTAALAAAHFDTARAQKRLEHEKANEEAYPEEARHVLAELRALLADPASPAERWEALAEDPFTQGDRLADVRFLLRTLAYARNPRHELSNLALAEDLAQRGLPLLAAFRFEDLAGGRNPGLDRRWDPRRPRFLRRAAAQYFAAEDDVSCRAVLAEIPERKAEDELMDGVAAYRMGDLGAARAALARAREKAPEAAMAEAAGRLGAFAGGGRDLSP
jgi:hypothetical protein